MKKTLVYILLLIPIFCANQLIAQQLHHLKVHELIDRQLINQEHTRTFERLQVQDFQGRIKPIQTLALELLRKVHGKNDYTYLNEEKLEQKLTSTQVFLGMQFKPDSWQLLPLIKIEKKAIPKLSKLLDINFKGFVAAAQFFDFKGNYKLKDLVAKAFAKSPGKRNAFDKDIIKIDERINIVWGIFNGQFLKIFPTPKDNTQKWYAPTDTDPKFELDDQLLFDKIIPTYLLQLERGKNTQNWKAANETISILKNFQAKNGKAIILSDQKVNWEIWYNKTSIFFICLILYTIVGLMLLIFGFLNIFFHKKSIHIFTSIIIVSTVIIFLFQGFGIFLRWYISGHAPWSNGYEATIFISWIGVLAGLLFSKKNTFPAAVSTILAVCLLGIAHGSLMSPEVTNLVPVLKSYWLMIHVAIITGSYGFLAMGSLLALIVLILINIKVFVKTPTLQSRIVELTTINQITSTIGLYMLTIGTFLGGIWANESWGRYWGWDPKETWALISIIIYSFVLHLRIIIPKNHIYIYNICSLFALSSLIMTFFGVNYYLSGLHSYAKGDSFPVPNWIYIVTPILILICILPKITHQIKNHLQKQNSKASASFSFPLNED